MLNPDFRCKPGKVFIVLFISIIYSMPIQAQSHQKNNLNLDERLKTYSWQKRVLLIVSPSAIDKKYIQQKAIIETQPGEVQERDLEIITFLADKISQADKRFLNKKFDVEYSQFKVVLIGKDGGSKLISNEPITMQKLFETIDAMPMRREEMKQN
jgi:hypothetical protein